MSEYVQVGHDVHHSLSSFQVVQNHFYSRAQDMLQFLVGVHKNMQNIFEFLTHFFISWKSQHTSSHFISLDVGLQLQHNGLQVVLSDSQIVSVFIDNRDLFIWQHFDLVDPCNPILFHYHSFEHHFESISVFHTHH